MPLSDSILGFQTGTYTVTRRPVGTFVDGNYVPNASPTTLSIAAVIQPAREIARVTAGRDMLEREQNQHVDHVMMMHTKTEVYTRTPTNDPDQITFEGSQWIVIRVEKWAMSGETFYQAIITRETNGGS